MTPCEDSQARIKEAEENGWTLCVVERCQEHLLLFPRDGRIWIEYAQALMQVSRYQDALRALDQAWEFSSERVRPGLCTCRAKLFRRRGDFDSAAQAYAQAADLCHSESFVFNFAGLLEHQRGDLRAAEDLLRRGAACVDSSSDESWLFLSGVLWALERHGEALDACEKAISLDPESRSARRRLEDIEAALEVRRAPRREPWERQVLAVGDSLANEMSLRDQSLRRIKEAQEKNWFCCALERCEEHVRLHANDARVWGAYARILTEFGLYERALEAADQAFLLCSEAAKPNALEIRGSLWAERGDFGQAATAYAESLALRPVSWMFEIAGTLEWHRGDLHAAEKLLRQGTICQAKGHDANCCWGSLVPVLWSLELYDEALQACIKAIQLDPEDERARASFEDLHAALAARADLRRDT